MIVNPLSYSAARGLASKAAGVARAHGAEVVVVNSLATLNAAVESILLRRQRQVIVLAGDGTVQAIVDQLASQAAGSWMPDLLVLPGGRSNLTSIDLVPGGRALATLELALKRASEQRWDEAVVERATLRNEQSPAAPRHGFFVAAALVDSVIRWCHQQRADEGGAVHAGALSTVWCLLKLSALALVGRTGLSCPPLRIDTDACGRMSEPTRVLLATTLLHRTGLFNPYAPRGKGALRLTAVALRAPRFWRSLPRLLTQKFSKSMDLDNGYLSGACERIQITGLHGYSLDGEEFDADPLRPVTITLGPRMRFLSL
ncbi:MAG: diacylglycerol kinase, catalytic region [Rhizobacter sp.]|nr:diacylglycerol kinase, catalytic region [Rhizobacter sp.]